jgi:hypothetical protein
MVIDFRYSLMDAMAKNSKPQTIERILMDRYENVATIDCGDGWYDIVGVNDFEEKPSLIIRYQWREPNGWTYRLVSPNYEIEA